MSKKLLECFQLITDAINSDWGRELGSFFDPRRKIRDRMWDTRHSRRPCIVKRTMSVMLYCSLFRAAI